MRTWIAGIFLIVTTGMISGCASSTAAKSDAQAGPPTDKAADAKACVMQSGGADVLQLTLPSGIKCAAKDGTLYVDASQYEVEIWLVDGAHTIDEGIGRIGPVIKDQFKDFKATGTTDLTVAGSPAKQLIGPGHEADDGDNGQADVIVFKVGDHVFIACTHDENLAPVAQQGILTVVNSAHAP